MTVLALGGAIGQIRLPRDPHIDSQRPEGPHSVLLQVQKPSM